MQININLTEEQQKALLTAERTIGGFAQRVIENRANRLIEEIVKKYADNLEGVTIEEQATITSHLAGKIVVNAEKLPDEVKRIIVRRANVKSMMEIIAEQELLDNPTKPVK